MSGECKAGHYVDNSVVAASRGIVCYGFEPIGQPMCPHLLKCMTENNLQRSRSIYIKRLIKRLTAEAQGSLPDAPENRKKLTPKMIKEMRAKNEQ